MRSLARKRFVSFEQLFEEYLKVNQPVVFEQPFDDKRIFSWTPDALRERVGNTIVKVSFSNQGRYHLDQANGGFVEEPVYMKFRDFVDKKVRSQSYYVQQTSIADYFPELLSDIPVRELLNPDLVNVMNIWIGGAGTVTPLHHDFANNFLIQCYGRKKVVLFEAHQTEFLYPYDAQSNHYPYVSRVDIRNPDLDAFPKYKQSDPIETVLSPGDVLFLPSTTWHQVESLSVSISVNIWFRQFDFQYAWPNMVRLIPTRYAALPHLHEITVPYRFSNVMEFCDHLLSHEYLFEACIAYTALLEHLVRQKAMHLNISAIRKKRTRLENDIEQAIACHNEFLRRDLYETADREEILFLLGVTKEMLDRYSLNFTHEEAVAHCSDIRSVISRVFL